MDILTDILPKVCTGFKNKSLFWDSSRLRGGLNIKIHSAPLLDEQVWTNTPSTPSTWVDTASIQCDAKICKTIQAANAQRTFKQCKSSAKKGWPLHRVTRYLQNALHIHAITDLLNPKIWSLLRVHSILWRRTMYMYASHRLDDRTRTRLLAFHSQYGQLHRCAKHYPCY